MRKRLAVLMATIMLLTGTAAGAAAAQAEPPDLELVTVCLTEEVDVLFPGVDPTIGPGTEEIPRFLAEFILFVLGPDAITEGPCPDTGGDGGGDGRGGGGGDAGAAAPLELTQETEQEAESGDIDQSFDVSQTGDNSNQTVGIQGTANTGNAQNITNVIDAGDFGDFDNDGFVFCDRDRDGKDDGDDDCFVIFSDFNDGFFNDGDRVFVNDGNNDDGDIEIEDSGAEITMSPNNTTNSSQQVNQAAAASAPHWVWTGSEWMWM